MLREEVFKQKNRPKLKRAAFYGTERVARFHKRTVYRSGVRLCYYRQMTKGD